MTTETDTDPLPDLQSRIHTLEPFVGHTPLFPVRLANDLPHVKIFAKLEWQQLGNSVKARPAFNIMKEAVRRGDLDGTRRLLDASSGNTGVAYGCVGAALGIPVTLCLPENASMQKQNTLKALGVEIIYTSKFGGTDDAQEKALELAQQYPDKYWYADQYANNDNWRAHYLTTANEIVAQTNEGITHFVAGLGTTGTFTGTSQRLKELNPDIRVTAVHPDTALHGLEGWKHLETAKVPKFYDADVADEHIEVSTEEAYEMMHQVAGNDGLLLSPSSAANMAGALKVAQNLDKGVVVTIFPDHGTNYPEVLNDVFKS